MKKNNIYNKSKKELYDNGWTIIKNVFSKHEVRQLREGAKFKKSVKTLYADVLSNPEIGHLVYDDRIIQILKGLLGGDVTYFREGSLLIETINGRKGGAFHRDNPDKYDQYGPDWVLNYDVVRIGIYLENHKDFSEGIGFLSGSNKGQEISPGNFVLVDNAPIKAGDILVWKLTTVHAGYPKRLKHINSNIAIARGSVQLYGTKYAISNLVYKYLPQFLTNPQGEERIVIHIAYGKTDSKHTKRYIEYCKCRSFATDRWQKTKYSKEIKEKITNKSGITFIDMSNIESDIEMIGSGGGHVQFPY